MKRFLSVLLAVLLLPALTPISQLSAETAETAPVEELTAEADAPAEETIPAAPADDTATEEQEAAEADTPTEEPILAAPAEEPEMFSAEPLEAAVEPALPLASRFIPDEYLSDLRFQVRLGSIDGILHANGILASGEETGDYTLYLPAHLVVRADFRLLASATFQSGAGGKSAFAFFDVNYGNALADDIRTSAIYLGEDFTHLTNALESGVAYGASPPTRDYVIRVFDGVDYMGGAVELTRYNITIKTYAATPYAPTAVAVTADGKERPLNIPFLSSDFRYSTDIFTSSSAVNIKWSGAKTVNGIAPTGKNGADGVTLTLNDLTWADGKSDIPIAVVSDAADISEVIYTLTLSKSPVDYFPKITKQPEAASYAQFTSPAPLTVEVETIGDGVLTYQWRRGKASSTSAAKAPFDGEGSNTGSCKPQTDIAYGNGGKGYYDCVITYAVNGYVYSVTSNTVLISIAISEAQAPVFTKQPVSATYLIGNEAAALTARATYDDASLVNPKYEWFRNETNSTTGGVSLGAAKAAGSGKDASCVPSVTEAGTFYYYCVATNTNGSGASAKIATSVSDVATIIVRENNLWSGGGTEGNPYLINDLTDFRILQEAVNTKYLPFPGSVFKLTADISLPAGWTPIGASKKENVSSGGNMVDITDMGRDLAPFAGTFDGDGHTIAVAEGGLTAFGYLRDATIKNLNIYGAKIAGYGVIAYVTVDYGADGTYSTGAPATALLENITLKSGTQTLYAGFAGGYSSGANRISILNCTVEEGVVIGYGKNAGAIGSFGGSFNGTITGSVSYATVYGTSGVGGLIGDKGQSMGPCGVYNSAFLGKIIATGEKVGGIIGAGYSGGGTAPQTPLTSIKNCYVVADITGSAAVGGILGAEPGNIDAYNDGTAAFITDNCFYGRLTATAADGYVGGIVAYYLGLNKAGASTGINNNYYLATSGDAGGIGYIENLVGRDADETFDSAELCIATTADEFANGSVTKKLNASDTSYKNWLQGEKYPYLSNAPIVYDLAISGAYKTEYYIGDALDLSGLVLTARWSDGKAETLAADSEGVSIKGYDGGTRGIQTLTAAYGAATATFQVTVLKPASGEPGATNTITVYFTLKGAPAHGGDTPIYLVKKNNLETWIARKAYTLDINATVADLIKQAIDAQGIIWSNPSGNYIEGFTRGGVYLGELTNGPNSGWVYTYNGVYSLNGIAEQFLESGDSVAMYYTDDWTQDDIKETVDPGGEWSGGTAAANPGAESDKPETEAASSTVVKDGEAITTVDKDAGTGAGGKLVVNVVTGGEAISKITALLPKEVMKAESDGKSEIEIRAELAALLLPEEAVADLSGRGADVTVSAAKNADGSYTFTLAAGGGALDKIEGGIRAAVPVQDAAGGTVALLVRADGTEEIIKKSCVKDGKLLVPLDGSATVKIIDNSKSFADVPAGAWYEGSVAFASARELFSGTGADAFSPDIPMTRAMLVTVLHRLENAPPASGASFADVDGGAYYAEAVLWANANGIAKGVSETGFAPGENITREQLATILYRYADALGADLNGSESAAAFADSGEVSDWAREALGRAVGAGLLQGRGDGTLAPRAEATRAETAAILERFLILFSI